MQYRHPQEFSPQSMICCYHGDNGQLIPRGDSLDACTIISYDNRSFQYCLSCQSILDPAQFRRNIGPCLRCDIGLDSVPPDGETYERTSFMCKLCPKKPLRRWCSPINRVCQDCYVKHHLSPDMDICYDCLEPTSRP